MIPELGVYGKEKADGLERRRLVAVVFDVDRRGVILDCRVVADGLSSGPCLANQRRHVATDRAIGAP